MGEVINFAAYKQFREDMEDEKIREDVLEFFMNSREYVPGTFSFDLQLDDDDE